jgi:hypothetical protein
MPDDWFRNRGWNDEIARRFEEKLGRARRKAQYLRIQAYTLTATHPEVALQLLERYFELENPRHQAQGHSQRAAALKTLGRIEQAADAYEAALACEVEFPNLKTGAYVELPMLVATERLTSRFDRALAVLDQHKDRPMFPVEHFLWHAARALILSSTGDRAAATADARLALEAAKLDHSGFRYHPTVGLVTEKHRTLLNEIAALGGAH